MGGANIFQVGVNDIDPADYVCISLPPCQVEEYSQQLGLCSKDLEMNPHSDDVLLTPRGAGGPLHYHINPAGESPSESKKISNYRWREGVGQEKMVKIAH